MRLETFGKRLKMLRIDKGLSQTDLRDKMEKQYGVKIGETYVSELERTDKKPSLEVAAAMAKALDVSLDYLALLVGEATSYQSAPTQTYISPEADEVAQLIDAMRPVHRTIILEMAQYLASPATQRRQILTEMRDALELVEQELGTDARTRVEKRMRRKWLAMDSDS